MGWIGNGGSAILACFYCCDNVMCRTARLSGAVLWIDNFSKILPRSLPSTTSTLYSKCLWSVTGYVVPTARVLPSLVLRPELRAMPIQLLTDVSEAELISFYQDWERKAPSLCYLDSVSRLVRCIPIVPPTKADVKKPVFLPDRLLPFNISSNPGLIHVLRSCYADGKDDIGKYRVFLSDCNIQLRALKVVLTNICRILLHVIYFQYLCNVVPHH